MLTHLICEEGEAGHNVTIRVVIAPIHDEIGDHYLRDKLLGKWGEHGRAVLAKLHETSGGQVQSQLILEALLGEVSELLDLRGCLRSVLTEQDSQIADQVQALETQGDKAIAH